MRERFESACASRDAATGAAAPARARRHRLLHLLPLGWVGAGAAAAAAGEGLLAAVCAAGAGTALGLQHTLRGSRRAIDRARDAAAREAGWIGLMQQVASVTSEAPSAEAALEACLRIVCRFMGWPLAHVHRVSEDGERVEPTRTWYCEDAARFRAFRDATETGVHAAGIGLPGRTLLWRRPLWLPDLTEDRGSRRAVEARRAGIVAGLGLPLCVDGEVIAVLEFLSEDAGEPDARALEVLAHLATQIGRVSERERASERIRNLAFFDGLTGLPNRQHFHHELERALEASRRSERPLALLFLDLDHFKHVNDTLGHALGDRLLAEVAERFRRSLRATDSVARADSRPGHGISRLGGDEFTVLLPGIASPLDAAVVARRILHTVSQPVDLDGNEVVPGASIGIAIHPGDGDDAGTLLQHADAAMYSAKSSGRNRFHFFDAITNAAGARRLEIEQSVRRAIDRDGLIVHYQPIWEARSRRLVGAEALVRMHGPDGVMGPDAFIPIAEEAGLIGRVGECVLRRACRQCREWTAAEPGQAARAAFPGFRVAVNLSSQHLRQRSVTGAVQQALREAGLEPSHLGIEITESTIMQDDESTRTALQRLAGMGVALALDDFGTGYSSLSYLRRFPLDRVKIDRTFVREIPENRDDCTLTSAIIAMAKSLRLDVVAEGVESQAQLDFLVERGCDHVQGYLLGRPMPADAFARLLDKDRDAGHDGPAHPHAGR